MATVRQKLVIWSARNPKGPKGLFINRMSIGTIWVNGVPFTYNADLVYRNEDALNTTIEDIYDNYEKRCTSKRRTIVIKKRSKPR